jgi:hypothetical protein
MKDPANDAKVMVKSEVDTPAAVPDSDADAQRMNSTINHILPKLNTSFSSVPSSNQKQDVLGFGT